VVELLKLGVKDKEDGETKARSKRVFIISEGCQPPGFHFRLRGKNHRKSERVVCSCYVGTFTIYIMDWDEEYEQQARPPPRDEDSDTNPFLLQTTPETPLEQLTRHWLNERHAPDILPAQEELLSGILDHLRRQVCGPSRAPLYLACGHKMNDR